MQSLLRPDRKKNGAGRRALLTGRRQLPRGDLGFGRERTRPEKSFITRPVYHLGSIVLSPGPTWKKWGGQKGSQLIHAISSSSNLRFREEGETRPGAPSSPAPHLPQGRLGASGDPLYCGLL